MENKFGKDYHTFIVAELSANHNGDKAIALETVAAAKRAGADAIKLQTYRADTITLNCTNDDFKIKQGTLWDGRYLYELYEEAYTPWEWHKEIYDAAHREGLICFSSPFDCSAVDFLETLGNPIYKIASFEITDIPLIKYAARTGKPIVISTGIATEEDISLAIAACREVGNNDITLLKCTSFYPTPISESNLAMIPDLATRFGVKSGLSDHTMGSTAPVVATCLGAAMIEKHFILDKNIGGPDAEFSMEEKDFKSMVTAIREAESAIGKISYQLTPKMMAGRDFCRSLYVTRKIEKEEIITSENIKSVRPGFGLHPKYFEKVIGKRVNKTLSFGDRLSLDDIEE